jgi:plasmid stabilization system protein ParE
MACVLWTPRAERHLEDIAYYIAVNDQRPLTAEKVVREIHEKCYLYADNPLLAAPRQDLGATYRAFRHKRWVIIYHPLDDGIVVEAVFDSTRDYTTLFRQGE